MQRNKVHHVHTVGRVARDLGVDEDLVHELTLGLEPEDGAHRRVLAVLTYLRGSDQ